MGRRRAHGKAAGTFMQFNKARALSEYGARGSATASVIRKTAKRRFEHNKPIRLLSLVNAEYWPSRRARCHMVQPTCFPLQLNPMLPDPS